MKRRDRRNRDCFLAGPNRPGARALDWTTLTAGLGVKSDHELLLTRARPSLWVKNKAKSEFTRSKKFYKRARRAFYWVYSFFNKERIVFDPTFNQ